MTAHWELMARQALNVRECIDTARADGLTHLLSIDMDELLFLPRGMKAFHHFVRSVSPSVVSLANTRSTCFLIKLLQMCVVIRDSCSSMAAG